MKIKSFKLGYFLKLAFNGLFKNRVMSISSIFVLLSCLVIMGSFALVTMNINANVSDVDTYCKIIVFAEKGTSDADLMQMKADLEKIDGVKKPVEFKDNETALNEQLSKYDIQSEFILETYKNDNPLKDSFIITYSPDATPSEVETIILKIETEVNHVAKYNLNMDIVEQVDNLKNAFTIIFSWLLILMVLVSVFVIINTVKLSVYARRDEIALMRYIGATDFFISIPYLIEGFIIGIVAAALAYGAQYLLYKYLMLELIGQYKIIKILPFSDVQGLIIVSFAVVGIAMGFIGSIISLKKYNKENA